MIESAVSPDSGPDPKVIAVPLDEMTSLYRDVQDTDDLPQHLLQQITHFYQHYKDLEENKWVKIEGWQGHDAACQEILVSIERFNQAPVKPCF